MKRYSYFLLVACVATLAFVSCKGKNDPNEPTEDYVIRQFANEPFLGETYITDYDYEAGNQFLLERYKEEASGACSSFRHGDFAARNLDWYVRDYAVLVVHVAADTTKGRYASVGIVSSNPFVNREMISCGEVKDVVSKNGKNGTTISNWRNIFPIFTTDGINEKGLCVNTNIVMHENGVRDNYTACTGGGKDVPQSEKTSFVSLPRFILDNCASCQDAINKCDSLHVTQAYQGALKYEDSHMFISDMNETVILEWYNDKMQITRFPRSKDFKCGNMPAIMTNFFNCRGVEHINDDGSIKLEELLAVHPYAMGVERYEWLREGWENVNSLESAKKQIAKVYYSNYFNLDSKWYTENGMSCVKVGNDWYYPTVYPATDECYVKAESLMDAITKMYAADNYMGGCLDAFGSLDLQMRNLDSGIESEDNWYTELTSIYDIKNKELHIQPQEGWYNHKYYKFSVFGNR